MRWKYRKNKNRNVKTESVEEYLARDGQIHRMKSSSKKYLSYDDRDYFESVESYECEKEFDLKNVDFDIRSKFYETQEWKSLKYKFIKSKKTEDLVCVICGKGPFTSDNWNEVCIDHIKPVKKFWEERLDINNLQVLCWICNRVKGNNYKEKFQLGDGTKAVLRKMKKVEVKIKEEKSKCEVCGSLGHTDHWGTDRNKERTGTQAKKQKKRKKFK